MLMLGVMCLNLSTTGECGNEYIALLYRPVYHDNPDEPWPVVFSACLRHPACGTVSCVYHMCRST